MDTFASHNVVATYLDAGQAKEAVSALKNQHFSDVEISFLSRSDEAAVSKEVVREEAEDLPVQVGGRAAAGGVAGGAAGGLLGLIAGGAAFAIPGVGPAVGAGIWTATAAGATAGATAGGVASGLTKMWDERYKDAVHEGGILVGVHTDDPVKVERASALLARQGPERVDVFDESGKPIARPET